jgi:hypothetical protein
MAFWVLLESSRTRSKKNAECWLNLLHFGCQLIQNGLLQNVYSDPIIFSALQKHRGSHFSLMLSSTTCNSLWISDTVSKRCPHSFIFNLGNKMKSWGKVRPVGRMENDNHVVVSNKLCDFQGCVGGRIV